MGLSPDAMRADMLRTKLERTIYNVSEWWGITPSLAADVLRGLQEQISKDQYIGQYSWPDPSRARYKPGMSNDQIRELAQAGAAAIAAHGEFPSQRKVWKWCVEHGAKKRQRDGLRIVQEVLTALSAREVPAAYVRACQEVNKPRPGPISI